MSDDKTVFQAKPQGSLRPGVRLNGMFEIEQLIAQGGMGEVYKGVAVASGDPVAIKLVRPDMARDPDVMALFRREAAILHDLLHDAIVRYYVFSLEPELQRFYIAMEFVDGVSLQNRLAGGALSPSDARVLLRRIGGALEQAHERGVIHRDISSDNIILPGGEVRKAKIVDFGIARAARPGEGTILGGGFAGKYNYVSPEQLGLFGGEVTPKSDIYSFGLVIAEALRGKAIDMGGREAEVIEKRRTVPDLSGIDVSLRPLLMAMLAPHPQDRPSSMAEIAAWGEAGTQIRPQEPAPPPPPAPAVKRLSLLGLALAAAGIVVLGVLGGALYALRDNLGLKGGTPVASPTAHETKLAEQTPPTSPPLPLGTPAPPPGTPPLPPGTPAVTPTLPTAEHSAQETPTTTATQEPMPGPTETGPAVETPPAPPTKPPATVVTADNLLQQMSPKPDRAELTLEPATVGVPYRAALPGFSDPTGKGLTLRATPAPPAGLSLNDLGGGLGEIAGQPTAPGQAVFDVVAATNFAKSAKMKVTLEVRPAPTPPPTAHSVTPAQTSVDLEDATAGVPYSAGLPPFRANAPVAVYAGPGLPGGLALNDLGSGLSQLSGAPQTAGRYAFDVVAATADGAEGRMQVRLTVAPPVVASPPPTTDTPGPTPSNTGVATLETPATSPSAFLNAYAGKPCFAARAVAGDPTGRSVTLIGADPEAFQRFGADFQQMVKVEPDVRGLVVQEAQCPAVEFLKSASAAGLGLPSLVLDTPEVGKGRPLSGTVQGLAGRPLLLLVVADDGKTFQLRTKAVSGDSATFLAKFTGDPSSFGKPQMVIAVASDQAINVGEPIVDTPSATLMPKLTAEGRALRANAAVALFKFVE